MNPIQKVGPGTAVTAAAAIALAAILGVFSSTGAWAASHTVGTISTAVGACLPGFKQTNKDAKGSYVCVSEVVKCPTRPIRYVTAGPRYNKATRRFEYACGVPAK